MTRKLHTYETRQNKNLYFYISLRRKLEKEGLEEELIMREKDIQRQMGEEKIRNARYNKRYKEIISEKIRSRYIREASGKGKGREWGEQE